MAAATAQAAERPVRVLHLLYSLGVGGMEMGVHKLVMGLDRSVVDSSVCSLTPVDPAQTLWPRDQRVHSFDRRHGNDPTLVVKLLRLFRRVRPDVVHTHAWGTLCEGVLAAKLARVPVVVHGEHGTMEMKPRNLRVQRHVWRRVDRVLAVSSALAERMAGAVDFPLSGITVIRNGVDLSRFGRGSREAARRRLGLRPSAFVVGTVGRLVPVKDQQLLLQALRPLRERGLDFQAVIVGDGPLRADLEAQVRTLGLDSEVTLLGGRDDVPDVMAAFDVFALPSLSEGLSNTVLEAMATGLPVVATRVGGNPELVQPAVTGTLVTPGSVEELTAALQSLHVDRERRLRLGLAGRQRAHVEFSLAGMFERYTELYLSAMEDSQGWRPRAALAAHQSNAALSLGRHP